MIVNRVPQKNHLQKKFTTIALHRRWRHKSTSEHRAAWRHDISYDDCLSYVLCKLSGNVSGRSSGLSSFNAAYLPVPTFRARYCRRQCGRCSAPVVPDSIPKNLKSGEATSTQMKNYSSESARDSHPASLPGADSAIITIVMSFGLSSGRRFRALLRHRTLPTCLYAP